MWGTGCRGIERNVPAREDLQRVAVHQAHCGHSEARADRQYRRSTVARHAVTYHYAVEGTKRLQSEGQAPARAAARPQGACLVSSSQQPSPPRTRAERLTARDHLLAAMSCTSSNVTSSPGSCEWVRPALARQAQHALAPNAQRPGLLPAARRHLDGRRLCFINLLKPQGAPYVGKCAAARTRRGAAPVRHSPPAGQRGGAGTAPLRHAQCMHVRGAWHGLGSLQGQRAREAHCQRFDRMGF